MAEEQMKTATGFNEDPGMIEQLRELAEAVPFVPFTCRPTATPGRNHWSRRVRNF
jgi:hypothetical protein